ncbi:hypothetical protein FRB99_000477 [Tulasnella sp. 403]|nr:hypothetical protein FRB99_000477 [Tulasnella sp. 403]
MVEISNLGNGKDWSWDDLLPFFKASETMVPPKSSDWAKEHGATFDPAFHGRSGPIRRGFVTWLGESHVPFFKSMNSLGVPTNPDSCSGYNIGVFTLATSIDPETSTRSSPASAYYRPNSRRIRLIDGAKVRKVILVPSTHGTYTAREVEFEKAGRIQRLSAGKEIVLCAGAYENPKILELSGMGNPQHLRALGITPLVDLPGVGENLQDHILIPSSFQLKPGIITGDNLTDPEFARGELVRYKQEGTGQYSSIHSAFSLIPFNRAVSSEKAGEILDLAQSAKCLHAIDYRLQNGQDILHSLQKKWYLDPRQGIFEGHVHARSSDPSDPPKIDPKYLSNKADLQLLIEAVRFAHRVARTEPLASMIVAEADPGPRVLCDDAALSEYIKTNFETAHHPLGTAAMMPRTCGGVVGPDLRVYGCNNLRIADASIIPIQLSAHLQATLYAIGEKAASMILRQHNHQHKRSKL